MGKFSTNVDLLKRSVTVIRENKKLALFPLIVYGCVLIMVAFYLAPVVLASTGHALTGPAHWEAIASHWFDVKSTVEGESSWSLKPAGYLLLAGLYLLSMFVATFFNVAFFHEVLGALDSRPVSIRGGVRFAASRLKAIAIWSLFAGLVGLLIRALEARIGAFGRRVVAVIGLAWSVASVFAIPAIVRKDQGVNPVRYLKFSANILRKTWGEAIVYVGIMLSGITPLIVLVGMTLHFLLVIPITILMIALFHFYSEVMFLGMWITAAIGSLVLLMGVFGAVEKVFLGALFIYATEGVVPGPFSEADMNAAWKVKAARKAR